MKRSTTCRTVRRIGSAWSLIVVTASSASAFAQQPQEPLPPPEGAQQVSPGAPPPGAPMPPPPPAPPPPPPVMQSAPMEVDRAASDFNPELRRWAVGYAGISQVPVGGANITVPAVGIRYWTSPTVGVDIAFGVGWAGGSTEVAGVSMDKDSITGFVISGGIPIALSTHRHVSFQLIPMLSVAHGSTSIDNGPGTTPTDLSGTRLDVGARAGFELFFGFIGIPELALSATVGMQFERRKYTAENGGITQSDTTLGFSTTVQNNPWDIFSGAVAARYYF